MIHEAIDLVTDFNLKVRPIECTDELAILMRKENLSQDEALEYYLRKIPKGSKDKYGRIVTLGDKVFDSLFKDPFTGKKIKTDENFQRSRAKRLPWIKYTLENATQIYELNEDNWITYYYVMQFLIRYKDEVTKKYENKVNNYLIVTKKKAGSPMSFVTAYTPDNELELLKKICRSRPYRGRDIVR